MSRVRAGVGWVGWAGLPGSSGQEMHHLRYQPDSLGQQTDGKETILPPMSSFCPLVLSTSPHLPALAVSQWKPKNPSSGPKHPFVPPLSPWVPQATVGVGMGGAGCRGGVGGAKTHFLSPWGSVCPSPDQVSEGAAGALALAL